LMVAGGVVLVFDEVFIALADAGVAGVDGTVEDAWSFEPVQLVQARTARRPIASEPMVLERGIALTF
jgi:hypothetical protein